MSGVGLSDFGGGRVANFHPGRRRTASRVELTPEYTTANVFPMNLTDRVIVIAEAVIAIAGVVRDNAPTIAGAVSEIRTAASVETETAIRR